MSNNFLDKLWPQRPDGFLSVWTKTANSARFFHTSEFSAAHDYMLANADFDDVYYTVGLLGQKPSSGRGKANDVAFLPALHADFDMLGDQNVHSQHLLPANVDELQVFLEEAHIPRPSVLVNSGNGVHAYWTLSEAINIGSDADRARAAKVLNGLAPV